MSMEQMTLDTRGLEAQSSRQLIEAAIAWINANRGAWATFVSMTRESARRYGDANVKGAVQRIRYETPIVSVDGSRPKLRNAFSPVFGRLLVAWYPDDFSDAVKRMHSKTDGCTLPPVPAWARSL